MISPHSRISDSSASPPLRTSSLQVTSLNSTAALQMQAIRQGDGELALLLNSKKDDTLKAASMYTQLNLEKHITLDNHHVNMVQEAKSKGLEKPPQQQLLLCSNKKSKTYCTVLYSPDIHHPYFHPRLPYIKRFRVMGSDTGIPRSGWEWQTHELQKYRMGWEW